MLRWTRLIWTCAFLLAGSGLQANDFKSLLDVVKETWPEQRHIGVICNYGLAENAVKELVEAAGPGVHITVADTRRIDQVWHAANVIRDRWANYVVLLPNGGVVCDGSFGATIAINRLAKLNIPTVATTPRALGQGALFAMGRETNGQLMMGDRLIGVIDVVLPKEIQIIKKASFTPPMGDAGGGRITVVSVGE